MVATFHSRYFIARTINNNKLKEGFCTDSTVSVKFCFAIVFNLKSSIQCQIVSSLSLRHFHLSKLIYNDLLMTGIEKKGLELCGTMSV